MSDTNKVPTRDSYYDNLRLFLMFIVVLCHGLEVTCGTSEGLTDLHKVLLSFCMPLFVFMTGFFAKSMAVDGGPKRMRIYNIVLMYVIAQGIKMLIGGSYKFLSPKYGNWFLLAMIAWYAVLPFMAKLKPAVVMTGSFAAAFLVGMDPDATSVFSISRLVCLFPFFMMGFYLPKEQAPRLREPKARILGICLLILGIFLCLTGWNDMASRGVLHFHKTYKQMEMSFWKGSILRLLRCVMALIMGYGIMSIIPNKQTKLTVLGTRTLPIFVVHTCFYYYLNNRTEFFPMITEMFPAGQRLAIIFILSVVMTIICGNKYFAKVFDKIMGYDFRGLMKKE